MTFDEFIELAEERTSAEEPFFLHMARALGIAYYAERRTEPWDNGHAKSYWPSSFNDVPGALAKVTRPVALYHHIPSLNLVIVDVSGELVGVRQASFQVLLLGLRREVLRELYEGLQQRLVLHS